MKKKILAMIPARIGSQRLKKKNLALINNKPLIEYVIDSSKKTKIFDKIYINSDDRIFKKIALKNNISFYLRNKKALKKMDHFSVEMVLLEFLFFK